MGGQGYIVLCVLILAWRWKVCLYPGCRICSAGLGPRAKRKLSYAVILGV
jgi:hypothetical protein